MAWNEIQHMKKLFTVAAPEIWAADFTYDAAKSWDSRNSHNPWCWFATADADSFPHFTAYAKDFTGVKPTDCLLKFHITFNYGRAMPVHVYYTVGGATRTVDRTARYRATDANRAGSQAEAALQYVDDHYAEFDTLAVKYLEGVFA